MPAPSFGYCLPIFANPGAALFRTPNYKALDAVTTLELGQHAEAIGFDSIWVADHLMLGKDESILEGWTVLSALGGSTTRARLGMIHQAHYFRSPALTAKMIATLDQLTGGRLTVFYDYGQQQREHDAYHLPYPDNVDVRIQQIVEGLELMMALWQTDEPLTLDTGTYAITDAVCNPKPVQRPHPPIWFGEPHPGILAACAQLGQGWNSTPVSVAELTRRLDALRDACNQAGRPFDDIETSVELQVLIVPDGDVRGALRRMIDLAPAGAPIDTAFQDYLSGASENLPASLSDTTLIGSADEVRAQVQSYVDVGIDHFLLWFLDAPERSGMEIFAGDVLPTFHSQP